MKVSAPRGDFCGIIPAHVRGPFIEIVFGVKITEMEGTDRA